MHIKHLGVCVLGVLLALPVYSDKEVIVEVTAHVDPELNIERISTAGTINLFNHAAEEYRITNNSSRDVRVSLRSTNSWKMKGTEDEFQYHPVVNDTALPVSGDTCTYDIDHSLFNSDKQYSLFIAFRTAPGTLTNVKAGDYHDRVTINVELN